MWHSSVESLLTSNDEKSNNLELSEVNVSDKRMESTQTDVLPNRKVVNSQALVPCVLKPNQLANVVVDKQNNEVVSCSVMENSNMKKL